MQIILYSIFIFVCGLGTGVLIGLLLKSGSTVVKYIKCQSGRYICFYEHREDIISNGDSKKEAKRNLKKLYAVVKEHESDIKNNVIK